MLAPMTEMLALPPQTGELVSVVLQARETLEDSTAASLSLSGLTKANQRRSCMINMSVLGGKIPLLPK